MTRNNKRSLMILLLLTFASVVFAASPKVIATTSWTAAYAELAGLEDVRVLAPMSMQHPPEYELSLRELFEVSRADYVIYAGYESMMSRIREALGSDSSVRLIQIQTVNSYPVIEASVLKIAAAFGTQVTAERNLLEIRQFLDSWEAEIQGREELEGTLVHFHQQGLARQLGIETSLVYGPASPTLNQIREALQIRPKVIIDNGHNPSSAAFTEQRPEPEIVTWINFPGIDDTHSLMDVLRYNKKNLDAALR